MIVPVYGISLFTKLVLGSTLLGITSSKLENIVKEKAIREYKEQQIIRKA